ncbi:MAG: peptidylprolyl isomerase [bacterium]|nr:peptidylprolyl isomerase [bacterium]
MGKILFAVVAVVVVAGAGWWLWSASSAAAPAAPILLADTTATSTQATSSPQTATITNPQTTMPDATVPAQNITSATLHTSLGDITFTFLPQQAPNTVANFIKLAQSGFYDSTKFHRVIKGFMDQGGDPLTKDDSKVAQWGTGGPGYKFADEIGPTNNNRAGAVAMANSGPNTAGSQFFINAVDNPNLNQGYTVFGQVTSGMDTVTKINNTPVDSADRPLTPVVLKSITLQ